MFEPQTLNVMCFYQLNHQFSPFYKVVIVFLDIQTDNEGEQDKLLPVWASVWLGLIQRVHHRLSLPTGSVQEATQHKTDTWGHDGVLANCCRVSIQYSNNGLTRETAVVLLVKVHFVFRSLQCIMDYEDDVLKELDQTFSVGLLL